MTFTGEGDVEVDPLSYGSTAPNPPLPANEGSPPAVSATLLPGEFFSYAAQAWHERYCK